MMLLSDSIVIVEVNRFDDVVINDCCDVAVSIVSLVKTDFRSSSVGKANERW